MLWLVVGGLIGLTVLGAAWLSWRAREAKRPWAVLSALFLGPDEVPEAKTDLRFATVAWALSLVTLGLVLLPVRAEAGALVFSLLAGAPLTAILLALLADLLRRLPVLKRRAASAREREGLSELLERARDELAVARDRVGGPQRDALVALEEALDQYASDLREGAREGLAERLHGVIDMARSCLLEEARQAARELGVRISATPAEVQAVYLALRQIYGGPEPLSGVDPQRAERIDQAYERLKLRFALEQSARALRALARPGVETRAQSRAAAQDEPCATTEDESRTATRDETLDETRDEPRPASLSDTSHRAAA